MQLCNSKSLNNILSSNLSVEEVNPNFSFENDDTVDFFHGKYGFFQNRALLMFSILLLHNQIDSL